MSEEHDFLIRERAYQLWEQDGKPAGKHLDYWLLAEKELSEGRTDDKPEPSTSAEKQPS